MLKNRHYSTSAGSVRSRNIASEIHQWLRRLVVQTLLIAMHVFALEASSYTCQFEKASNCQQTLLIHIESAFLM